MTVLQRYLVLVEAASALPVSMGDELIAVFGRDPFVLLVACLLSLRARDRVVYPVVMQLFSAVRTPQELWDFDQSSLEQLLKPIGFYRTKTRVLRAVCDVLICRHGSSVPTSSTELGQLPGVGSKTVAFMMAYAYQIPALCVDTHVHRLANAFGWVQTRTPEQTQRALEALVPREQWHLVHTTLVRWGQHVCRPHGVATAHRTLHDQWCLCNKVTDGTAKTG